MTRTPLSITETQFTDNTTYQIPISKASSGVAMVTKGYINYFIMGTTTFITLGAGESIELESPAEIRSATFQRTGATDSTLVVYLME